MKDGQHEKINNYIYGYLGESLIKVTNPRYIVGLWDLTKKYIEDNNIQPTYLSEYLDSNGNWDHSLYYSNFEISNLNFWRSDIYKKYYNTIDQNGGIYYHRWGDAIIHFLALAMLVDKNRVYCFKDIDYSHQDFRPNKKTLIATMLNCFMKSILFKKISNNMQIRKSKKFIRLRDLLIKLFLS